MSFAAGLILGEITGHKPNILLFWEKDLDLVTNTMLAFNMTPKDEVKQNLLNQLLVDSKSQEDKLTAARLISNDDRQKAANAVRSLMNKE